ncbi:hypothetical protein FSY75_20615 [Streptomyces sp. TR1341]|uniref:Uncharacterized protein n=1 Tax=Streptomyces murinus TaxID=33900 RepID=A0A7W3RP41_STRMR|nr:MULTISPECIES: hypothetical protein [Streptomyces]NDK26814.1 hypothetical protein [Streptomyces sp. TR1341]MBA9056940.1 hypothetical protein [Streptomyces murinus]UWW91327.1 hypothetical protein GO605_11020 [Streptomyces murinus]WSI88575.1 hypothetical protein OG516_30470 [Streptomyces murinus]WUD10206.1 hypothetical protein OG586_30160 [Streptomyces murinus]
MKHFPDPPPVMERLSRALRDLSAVERWAAHTGNGGPSDGGAPDGPVADGAWEGPRFGVATESCDGMHEVVGITWSAPPGAGPCGAPAEADRAVLHSSVRALLDMAEHESGPAHTVVVLTARGPRVLSCRLGGTTVTATGAGRD